MESGAEHEEGPKEDAAVKQVEGLMKQDRDRILAAERSGQLVERTWVNCEARKQLAAAGRKMTHRAEVA
jgi:hypothetical protein